MERTMTDAEVIQEFRSELCYCGRAKRTKTNCCRVCFRALPASLQRRLYNPFYRGYQEAHEEAKTFLLELYKERSS